MNRETLTTDRPADDQPAEDRPADGRLANGSDETISVVVPTFNEEASLERLHDGITTAMKEAGAAYEVIFVDDGSSDSSWKVIETIISVDDRVRGIKLRRNFGKAAALDAGFHAAGGQIVITMDADLQDDPKEIPRFLEKLQAGFDVVSGWKKVRHDPWHKVLPSRVFNRLVSGLTGVHLHDHNCGFKAYRHQIFDEVRLYGERHRFVPVLAAERGWKVGEIEVLHHARPFGQSKYGVSRLLKGFLDLLTIYFVTVFGKRDERSQTISTNGSIISLTLKMKRSLKSVNLSDACDEHFAASLAAVPSPISPGTFSAPGRNPISRDSPNRIARNDKPRRTYRAPVPLGP